MWVPRAWADDDIPALVGGGAGGAVRAGGDCIMPRQAWETTASARKVSASRFERGSKGSRGSHGAEGALGTRWQGKMLTPTSHDHSPAGTSPQSGKRARYHRLRPRKG